MFFLEAVEVDFPVEESGSSGISACLENREHLKYFRNVGCEVTSHDKGEITKLTIKARYTNIPGSAFSLHHDNIPGIFSVITMF